MAIHSNGVAKDSLIGASATTLANSWVYVLRCTCVLYGMELFLYLGKPLALKLLHKAPRTVQASLNALNFLTVYLAGWITSVSQVGVSI